MTATSVCCDPVEQHMAAIEVISSITNCFVLHTARHSWASQPSAAYGLLPQALSLDWHPRIICMIVQVCDQRQQHVEPWHSGGFQARVVHATIAYKGALTAPAAQTLLQVIDQYLAQLRLSAPPQPASDDDTAHDSTSGTEPDTSDAGASQDCDQRKKGMATGAAARAPALRATLFKQAADCVVCRHALSAGRAAARLRLDVRTLEDTYLLGMQAALTSAHDAAMVRRSAPNSSSRNSSGSGGSDTFWRERWLASFDGARSSSGSGEAGAAEGSGGAAVAALARCMLVAAAAHAAAPPAAGKGAGKVSKGRWRAAEHLHSPGGPNAVSVSCNCDAGSQRSGANLAPGMHLDRSRFAVDTERAYPQLKHMLRDARKPAAQVLHAVPLHVQQIVQRFHVEALHEGW